jgi:hypothetical protein
MFQGSLLIALRMVSERSIQDWLAERAFSLGVQPMRMSTSSFETTVQAAL